MLNVLTTIVSARELNR